MIPIYICDDETLLLSQLKKLVSDQVMIAAYDMGPYRLSQLRKNCWWK